eukprot:6964986-Ditylum_brightwellii.AAC.1
MATAADVHIYLDITFGNDSSPRRLKRKELFESICQLCLKNNPAADFKDPVKDKSDISKAVTHSFVSSRKRR